MVYFNKTDYENIERCPWCRSYGYKRWGKPVRNFISVVCRSCGLIYVRNRLNKEALKKYYAGYLSNVHQKNSVLKRQRQRMYKLEFNLIRKYCAAGSVLDIGCSGGYFLNYFDKAGYKCSGVEFGAEAARVAMKRYDVYLGDFSEIDIRKKYDLMIFRGVIEHVPYPKAYLDKAIKFLKKGGYIYITSTPNSGSLCCNLFKEQWNQHVPEAHLMHFSTDIFDIYFKRKGLSKISQIFFYEETPYADIENDVLNVAKAIYCKRAGNDIKFKSPAFWGSMMSLVYKYER